MRARWLILFFLGKLIVLFRGSAVNSSQLTGQSAPSGQFIETSANFWDCVSTCSTSDGGLPPSCIDDCCFGLSSVQYSVVLVRKHQQFRVIKQSHRIPNTCYVSCFPTTVKLFYSKSFKYIGVIPTHNLYGVSVNNSINCETTKIKEAPAVYRYLLVLSRTIRHPSHLRQITCVLYPKFKKLQLFWKFFAFCTCNIRKRVL